MSIATLLLEAASRFAPWKVACELAATVDVVLVGEQVIDGVQGSESDRILLIGQADPKQNGPWVMKAGEWERPLDYDAAGGATRGATIVVLRGTNAGVWRLTSPTAGDITVDQTATTWTQVGLFDAPSALPSIDPGQLLGRAATALGAGAAAALSTAEIGAIVRAALASVTSAVSVNSQKITSLGAPTDPTDAATKAYADAAADTRTAKLAVRFRHTATAVPAGTGSHGGVTSAAGDRALLDQLLPEEDRGIYVVVSGGSGTWTRATDCDAAADIVHGALVLVVEGTDAGKQYKLDQLGATPGVTPLTFSQVGGGGGSSYTAGEGLDLDGTEFLVDPSDTLVFSDVGAPNRVMRMPASGVLPVSAIDGGASLALTAAAVNIATTAGDVLAAGNPTGAATIDGLTTTVKAAGSIALRPTGDTGDSLQVVWSSGAGPATEIRAVENRLFLSAGSGSAQDDDTRLRMVSDANGANWYFDYDGTQGLALLVNPAGACFLDAANAASFALRHNGTNRVQVNATGLGFFNSTPAAKPTVTGSRGGNAALASLLTALATLGLITDSSTA